MAICNYTPFPCLSFASLDQHDQEFYVVVMRVTLDIDKNNCLVYAQDQLPLSMQDQYYGQVNQSSVKYESDLAPFKPKCDVIVNGSAYAPNRKPGYCFEAGIRILSLPTLPPRPYGLNPQMKPSQSAIGRWEQRVSTMQANPSRFGKILLSKRLMVTGPRYWQKSMFGYYNLGRLKPLGRLELRYDYAYGGQCEIGIQERAARRVRKKFRLTPKQRKAHPKGEQKAPMAHTAYETNPIGQGYAEPWYLNAKKQKQISAPQILPPHTRLRWAKHYPVEGFGFIGRSWLPRRNLAGTYDETWLKNRHPYLPVDFDFRYWNGAHPDMQIPYLQGGEQIELFNLTPSGNLVFQLPEDTPYILVRYHSGQIGWAKANLDTLIIEPDQRQVHMAYRATIMSEPKVRLLEARLIQKNQAQIETIPSQEVMHG